MLRFFYCWLLRLHPAGFRKRFAEEMLSIFDHVDRKGAAALMVDALISLVRQWAIRPEYREEKEPASVLVGPNGLPAFAMIESFSPRKDALIEGAVLTCIAYSALFVALRHSKPHYVYLPSITFETRASPDLEPPPSTNNERLARTLERPRTQPAIATRIKSSETHRQRQSKRMPSKSNSSSRDPESGEHFPSHTPKMSSEADSLSFSKRKSSDYPAQFIKSEEQAKSDAVGEVNQAAPTRHLGQSLSQLSAATPRPKESFDSYVGLYLADFPNKLSVVISVQDGRLAVEVSGEQKAVLLQADGGRFVFSGPQNNWIEFLKDGNGTPCGLRIYRSGSKLRELRKVN
jgi:hypothetical protein